MKSSISASISSSRMALAAWSTVHHHGPLEVGDGAGYRVYAVIVGERTAVFGDVGELAPRALARPLGLLAWGRMRPELVTRHAPPIRYEDRTTARRRSSPRQHQQNDREKRPHAAEAEQQHAAEPSAIRLPA